MDNIEICAVYEGLVTICESITIVFLLYYFGVGYSVCGYELFGALSYSCGCEYYGV